MPLARYFFFVGGVLLALLFIVDEFLPKFPVVEKKQANLPIIRIYSDRKWPERIVYDTSLPTIVPTSVVTAEEVVPPPDMIAEVSTGVKKWETLAMQPSSSLGRLQASNAKMQEPKPQHHRKVATKRASAPRVAMARQLQFGWLGWTFW